MTHRRRNYIWKGVAREPDDRILTVTVDYLLSHISKDDAEEALGHLRRGGKVLFAVERFKPFGFIETITAGATPMDRRGVVQLFVRLGWFQLKTLADMIADRTGRRPGTDEISGLDELEEIVPWLPAGPDGFEDPGIVGHDTIDINDMDSRLFAHELATLETDMIDVSRAEEALVMRHFKKGR